jgi:hypothetical protein
MSVVLSTVYFVHIYKLASDRALNRLEIGELLQNRGLGDDGLIRMASQITFL